VSDIDDMKDVFPPASPLAVFAVETATLTVAPPVVGHGSRSSVKGDDEWRPFPEQELSLTQHARQVIERFDFQVEVSSIRTVGDPNTRGPGIILIDPWFIADDDGRSALESAVKQLPRWVLLLLVLDKPGDPRTRDLADGVREILSTAHALPTDSSRKAARGVSSLNDFLSIVPSLVVEAERQYLRYRSGRVGSQPSDKRPSLRRPRLEQPATTPDKSATAQDLLRETPDA
jgi:FxsC-like protein